MALCIDQVLPSYSPRDAIGNEAKLMQELLTESLRFREQGGSTFVLVGPSQAPLDKFTCAFRGSEIETAGRNLGAKQGVALLRWVPGWLNPRLIENAAPDWFELRLGVAV